MKTPSKLPSSAYFGAALLVMLFFLTHFQAQAQLISAQKDTVLVSKNEKAKHFKYPFYLDLSLEIGGDLISGANANWGIYLNTKHAIGVSYFTVTSPFSPRYNQTTSMQCIGLQYCGSPFRNLTTRKIFYYKIDIGRVFKPTHAIEFTTMSNIQAQFDSRRSKPYMYRTTIGMRLIFLNIYLAFGNTGDLVWNYSNNIYTPNTQTFKFTHGVIGIGITIPSKKI